MKNSVVLMKPYTNEQVWAALAEVAEEPFNPFCWFSIEKLGRPSITGWGVEEFYRIPRPASPAKRLDGERNTCGDDR